MGKSTLAGTPWLASIRKGLSIKTTVRMTRWLVMGMALAARNCGVARTLSCFSGHDKHIRVWLALG